MRARCAKDEGSTIPLILGMFLIVLLLVAGSVAAGDAFVHQSALQDVCDGAAVAAASSADLDTGRHAGGAAGDFLDLDDVQGAVDDYQARDPERRDIRMQASVSPDAQTVTVQCTQTTTVAFGAFFGFGSGIGHHATSTARSPERTN
jgi:Flp pilus assembly protein TadG